MAIDSRTLASPIIIPGQDRRRQSGSVDAESAATRPAVHVYGSSPPIRLPSFSPSSSGVSFGSPLLEERSRSPRMPRHQRRSEARRRGSPRVLPTADTSFGLSSGSSSIDDTISPQMAVSLFSNLSLDDFDPQADSAPMPSPVCPDPRHTGRSPSRQPAQRPPWDADESFSLVSKQGRRLLRSAQLPMEQVLEFESLIFERLSTKTPRRRLVDAAADGRHFIILTVQNPFQRSLLHSVCQYYRLHSQTIKNEANQNLATLVRATSQSSQMPEMRLTDYLAARFGRLRPS